MIMTRELCSIVQLMLAVDSVLRVRASLVRLELTPAQNCWNSSSTPLATVLVDTFNFNLLIEF